MTTPLRVALYARISQDSSGMRLGVEDQLERGRAYAELKGFQVVAEEHDNAISAFRGKHRPGFQRLLNLTRSGAVDAVVVYQFSRMTREPEERVKLIKEFAALGVDLHETQGMVYNLNTAQGRSALDAAGNQATFESDVKTERVKAAVDRRTKVGRHVSHPGYGWRSTGETSAQRGYELHPEQSAVVQDLARAVAEGRPLRRLAAELNDAGVLPPGAFTVLGEVPRRFRSAAWDKDGPAPRSYDGDDTTDPPVWAAITIKQVLSRRSNIAKLVHKDDEVDAAWPPILSDEVYSAVMRRIESGKGQGKSAPRAARRINLLTGGVAYCGECGGTLVVAKRKIPKKDGTVRINRAYRCGGVPGKKQKGCTQRRVDHLDAFARDALIARLSRPDAFTWLMGDDGEAQAATEELAALSHQQEEAARAQVAGQITLAQLLIINEGIAPRLEAARVRKERATASVDLALLERLAGPKAATAWDQLDVAQRRLALEAVGMRIDVGRSVPRGVPLDELDQETVRLSFGGA